MTAEARRLFERRRAAIHQCSFTPAAHDRRVGAEVELLVYDDETNAPIRLLEGARNLIGLLRKHSAALGWTEIAGYGTVPTFGTADGAVVSFEPGGQIEISSPAHASGSDLAGALRDMVLSVRSALAPHGIRLDSIGIDPFHDARSIPQQLPVERYRAMTDYFERIGPYGIRMMRQTAAIQVSVDRGSKPMERWRLLNGLAPYLVAMFANSPRYRGQDSGHQSYRAHCWRKLDVTRTGVFPADDDPAGAYATFAMDAGDMFRTDAHGAARAFGAWPAESSSDAGWENHLTTLFPEIRPRGHFEVRSCDAIDPHWYVVPILLICGLAYDEQSAREATLLTTSSAGVLHAAGETALRNPSIADTARDLFGLALRGAARLGNAYFSAADIGVAREFYDRYTAHGRSPADDHLTAPSDLRHTLLECGPSARDHRGSAESSP
jgi:glutamate--cysteine ligase